MQNRNQAHINPRCIEGNKYPNSLPQQYPHGVAWQITILSYFLGTSEFGSFCNTFLSRLLVFIVNSGLSSGICGIASAVSWRVNIVQSWTVDSSGKLLLLACTEALCMTRVGVGRRIPVLVPRDLEKP